MNEKVYFLFQEGESIMGGEAGQQEAEGQILNHNHRAERGLEGQEYKLSE